MTEAYDGRQVVGMDLHRRRSVIVRMTEDGRKLETVRITNSPAALRREIAKAGQHPRVAVEATYGWYWAADVLEAAGAGVHLAHPLGVQACSCRRVKNDQRDAAHLTDLLRMGRRTLRIGPAEFLSDDQAPAYGRLAGRGELQRFSSLMTRTGRQSRGGAVITTGWASGCSSAQCGSWPTRWMSHR